MSAREQLEHYLAAVRRRLRARTYARAAAVACAAVLLLTLGWVWLLQYDAFDRTLVLAGRGLILALLIAIGIGLVVLPLRRLRRDDGAAELEKRLPAQAGRLQTYLDMQRQPQPAGFLAELLAADALHPDRATPPAGVVPSSRLWLTGGIAAAAAIALVVLLVAGPSFWGYGSRHLLLGAAVPRDAVPVRSVTVVPGDVKVRRNSDLTIRAKVQGFSPDHAQLFVRYDDRQSWERAPMQVVQEQDGEHWEFKLFALRAPLHYYVAAQDRRGEERSIEHQVGVVDLPKIERVRLIYDYPKWTDLPRHIEDTARDIRAVADTSVRVEVIADAPLEAPMIVVDGEPASMDRTAQGGTGDIRVAKPGRYHISARVMDELVALTDEYRIEIVADEKPSIEIRKPGRDWRATSIEEVPVDVAARDDFRLQQVELRYSINGGEEQARRIASGSRQADVESLLRMEELGEKHTAEKALVPGDLVSYYAVARDRGQSVETDLFVVQVQPFERRFSEGQGGGGGGGDMGDDQGAISERQREILLATWNTQRSLRTNAKSRAQLQDSARMLSELQVTLATQARNLAERTRARGDTAADERIARFVDSLDRAAQAMDPAAKYLEAFKLDDAIPLEQQALQQLLRAEAAFRDVQISMQRDQSQGAGQQAARNFTEMFELEMDVDKNHYETESALSQRNQDEELDEAIRKLKELAERQEKLAQQANRTAPREQRWQQEQLRREAEDLRRRLAQLEQSQSQSTQSGQASQQSGSSAQQSALESMREALEDMRAANQEDGGDRRSAAEASRNLRRALDRMQQPQGDSMAEQVEGLADRADKLVAEQRRVESELYDALGDAMASSQQRGQLAPERARKLVESKQRMADEVSDIQQRMRAALNDHGNSNPDAARRLGEALGELETSSLAHRLERSATEIRYGRARDAAPREGLIADALDALQADLRDVSQLAASERQEATEQADPQRLLAQLGDLRRALRDAERAGESSTDPSQGQPGERGSGQTSSSALTAWNPGNNSAPREQGGGSFRARDAAEIGRNLEELANRPQGLNLSAAEIQALRRMAREARGLSGNSLQELAALSQQLGRLELATLAALEKSRNAPSAHASASASDTPQYREAVAEYYRRLGGGCSNAEGATAC